MSEFAIVTCVAFTDTPRFWPTAPSPAISTRSSSMWCGTSASVVCAGAPEGDHVAGATDVGVEAETDDAVVGGRGRGREHREAVRGAERRQLRAIAGIDARARGRQRRVVGRQRDDVAAALGRQHEVAGVDGARRQTDRLAGHRPRQRVLEIAAGRDVDRRRVSRRTVGDRELGPERGGARFAGVILAIALLRVAAAADVDERDPRLPRVERVVDGLLHERGEIEIDSRVGGVGHGDGAVALAQIASGRLPGGACLPADPRRLSFHEWRRQPIDRDRTRRAGRAET